jgi:hypothetical protein
MKSLKIVEELRKLMDVYGCYGSENRTPECEKLIEKKFDGDILEHIKYLLEKYKYEYKSFEQNRVNYGDYYNAYILSFIDQDNELHMITVEIEDC